MVPISERLESVLWPACQDLVTERRTFQESFDDFEYLLALVESYYEPDRSRRNGVWGPWGCFVWRRQCVAAAALKRELSKEKQNLPLLRAGFFDGNPELLDKALDGLETYFTNNVDDYWRERR